MFIALAPDVFCLLDSLADLELGNPHFFPAFASDCVWRLPSDSDLDEVLCPHISQ